MVERTVPLGAPRETQEPSTRARKDSRAGPTWAVGPGSEASRLQRTSPSWNPNQTPQESCPLSRSRAVKSLSLAHPVSLHLPLPRPPFHLSSPSPIQGSRPKSGPTGMDWPPIQGSPGCTRCRHDIKGEEKVRTRDISSRARTSVRGVRSRSG